MTQGFCGGEAAEVEHRGTVEDQTAPCRNRECATTAINSPEKAEGLSIQGRQGHGFEELFETLFQPETPCRSRIKSSGQNFESSSDKLEAQNTLLR